MHKTIKRSAPVKTDHKFKPKSHRTKGPQMSEMDETPQELPEVDTPTEVVEPAPVQSKKSPEAHAHKGDPMHEHKEDSAAKEDKRPGKEGQPLVKILKLQRAISEHDTIIAVGNTAGIGPHAGVVEIDGEKIPYKMASPDSLHSCVRGEEGKGGAKHNVGANVTFLPNVETPLEKELRLSEEKEHRTKLNVNRIADEEKNQAEERAQSNVRRTPEGQTGIPETR